MQYQQDQAVQRDFSVGRFFVLSLYGLLILNLAFRFGIDAVGLFCVPANGPYGFYSIGRYFDLNYWSLLSLKK